jgi:hypothetical protein
MGGSRPAQMIAPLKTKLVDAEVTEPGDSQVERFSLPLRRRPESEPLSDAAVMPSLGHHAACRVCGFSARREFFDFAVAEIVGGSSLWGAACSTSMLSSDRARYVDPRSLSDRSMVTEQPRLRKPVSAARVVCGSQSVAAVSSSSVATQSR